VNYIELRVDRRVAAVLLAVVMLLGATKVGYYYGYKVAMQDATEAVREIISDIQKGQEGNEKLQGV
jgi:hypothetical protein